MALPVIQPSFAAGELSPALYGRVDLAKFHSGAALMRNVFADYRGGASNRPGTAFVGPCLPGINRTIGFTFSTLQTYALVFSDYAMRVVMNGGIVLEAPLPVTGVSAGLPCLVFTGGLATWVPGDWIFITNTPYSELNGKFFTVSANSFGIITLADIDGNVIDSTPWGGGPGGGTASRVYTLATPYSQFDLALLKFTQSADVMTLCHPNYAPQLLTRTAHDAWTIAAASFVSTAPTPTAPNAIPSTTGDGTVYNYVITATMADGRESLPSVAATALDSKTMSATSGANVLVSWTAVAGAVTYSVYRQPEIPADSPTVEQLFGFVGSIDASKAGGIPTFRDCNIAPDYSRTPPIDFNPFAAANDPGCTAYHQQRQVFAGSNAQPQTAWFSKTADYLNFAFSEPSRADDSIIATINAREVNAIKHLVSMDELLALSSHGAWKVDAGNQGGAITPYAIEANAQAYNGCSDVPPLVINKDLLYVQAKGSIVRDLAYNYFVKVYTGSDLTVLASHLFSGHSILEWAWAEEPFKLVWAVREDGTLLTFTFLKEQEIYAWAHSDTLGEFKSVCSISEGEEDAVYFIVNRPTTGGVYRQYIERLASRVLRAVPEHNVPADFSRFWFVDCGLSTTLNFPTDTVTPFATLVTPDGFDWWAKPGIVGATVNVGGAGYVAPVATIVDPTGSGLDLVLTVAAGVITAAIVVQPGHDYTNPVVTITDSAGAGARVSLDFSRDVEMVCQNAATLAGALVGDLFLINGGFGYVRKVNSVRSVTVNMLQAMGDPYPAVSGEWSCTHTLTKVYGLAHLIGHEVAILADGNVQPNQVVDADGSITLDHPAAAVVVGLPYFSQLKSLYADIPGEATVQGRRKAIPAVTVRQQDSRGLRIGRAVKPGQVSELVEFKERDSDVAMGTPVPAFTGDRRVETPPGYDVPGQVIVEQSYPLPMTVLALIPEIAVGDTVSAS
jgi:hypothetical protein